MEVDEITIADQLGLDPSCQVCSTRTQRSRKHRNANEGLSIEMGLTPQIYDRDKSPPGLSKPSTLPGHSAQPGLLPAQDQLVDTRYPSNTGIWFAMTNRASFYLYWDANRKLVTPHFIQINPQQLHGVHLGFKVHSGIQSKVPQQSLQFILLCCTKKKNVWSTTALLQTFDFQRTLSSLSTRSGATLNKQDSNNSKTKKKAEIRMEPLFVQKTV